MAGAKSFTIYDSLDTRLDFAGNLKFVLESYDQAEVLLTLEEDTHYTLVVVDGDSTQGEADAFRVSLTEQGIRSPKGMEYWRQGTIRNILRNEKYCGDVRYQKSYSKDFLTHKSVKNRDVLPQWYWENDHPAIIKRNQWDQVQKLLDDGSWRKSSKRPKAMEKKFTVTKVKSGALRGYFLLDMLWTKKERDQFIQIINSINEFDEDQEERNE